MHAWGPAAGTGSSCRHHAVHCHLSACAHSAGNLHYGENNGCETETHLVFWDSLNTTRYVPATELFYFPDAVVGGGLRLGCAWRLHGHRFWRCDSIARPTTAPPSLPLPRAAATFGVEDVPAFRDMFEIAAIDMAFAFAPLSVDSECVARCAKLEASGKQQKIPPSPPADKHSASLAGAEPHADNKYGTSRTITACAWLLGAGWWVGVLFVVASHSATPTSHPFFHTPLAQPSFRR